MAPFFGVFEVEETGTFRSYSSAFMFASSAACLWRLVTTMVALLVIELFDEGQNLLE